MLTRLFMRPIERAMFVGFWNFILPAIGALAGGIGKHRAEGKVAEANQTVNRDQQRLDAERARLQNEQANAQLEMERRKYEDSAPRERLRDIAHAQSLRDVQDYHMDRPDGVPNMSFSGGLRPSLFDGMTRGAANYAAQDGLRRLAAGDHWQAPTHMNFQQGALPKSGIFDKLLGIAGVAGSAYDALNGAGAFNKPAPDTSLGTTVSDGTSVGFADPSLARQFSTEELLRQAKSTPPFVSSNIRPPRF